MADVLSEPPAETLLAEFERKYMWWQPIGGSRHSEDRIIAQVMNLGTYDDIRRLEKAIGRERLAATLGRAAAGWLSDRSWEFWRGRLSAHGFVVADAPPRRSFNAV